MDRGPGPSKDVAMFLEENLCHHESLASDNDGNSNELFYVSKLYILLYSHLHFPRVAYFDIMKRARPAFGTGAHIIPIF